MRACLLAASAVVLYTRTTRNVYVVSNRWVVYPSLGVRNTFDPTHP
jgi:hypothetical protein